MAVAGAAIAVAGLALQAYGTVDAKRQADKIAAQKRAAAEFEAGQLEVQAGQEKAASQRTAMVEGRQTALVQSRAIALAAASGGTATDPTVLRIIGGIASEGAYRQNVALYQGEEKARQLRIAAAADRMSGDISAGATLASARALEIGGAGRIAGEAATMFARYGYDSPASVTNRPMSTPSYGYDASTAGPGPG